MSIYHFECPAKINLGLSIGERLESGLHRVATVMHKIPLADKIFIKKLRRDERDQLVCDHPDVPTAQDNLIWRTIALLREIESLPPYYVQLRKNIPIAAGLAGGSSNAGVILRDLNTAAYLHQTLDQIEALALRLGADVPFFAGSDLCLWERDHGLPTRYARILPPLPDCQLVLVYQDFGLETAAMYQAVDDWRAQHPASDDLDLTDLATALRHRDLFQIGKHLRNDFEPTVFALHPELETIRDQLLAAGALGAGLTGKGPTLYALFPPEVAIDLAGLGCQYQVLPITES